jgi:ADP-ribosylglycohydrolase
LIDRLRRCQIGDGEIGTVMRIAPVGLVSNPNVTFQLGAETSVLTHGHPTASASAGFLAVVISGIVGGATLKDAISHAKRSLRAAPEHAESLSAIEKGETLAASGNADAAKVEQLGGGWIAEEAVAIALYSVLATSDFEEAIILAVNHSGDSDSTGAIAGNIAGALYGVDAIPNRWLDALELRDEIITMADDLLGLREGTIDLEDDGTWDRYPGW